jgi:ribonuclease HI
MYKSNWLNMSITRIKYYMQDIVIYTDGACKSNPGPGGWGYYAVFKGGYRESFGGTKHTTNNAMELTAAIKALQFCLDEFQGHNIIIYTDSNYVKQGITSWVSGWIRNGWRTANGKPVKNKVLWMALNKYNSTLAVEWRWVKGHSGNPGNERADSLANRGVPSV